MIFGPIVNSEHLVVELERFIDWLVSLLLNACQEARNQQVRPSIDDKAWLTFESAQEFLQDADII